MKRSSLISSIILSSSLMVVANPAPEPAPAISPATNGFNLDWDGTNGNTYFVEYSYDLISWQYMPIIKSGTGIPLGYGFNSSRAKMFFRLRFTDVATSDAMTDDFDGDGISNWNEIRIGGTGTNPFMWDSDGDGKSDYYADSNDNGMSDGWETLYGNVGDLDPDDNSDDDSWSNLKESIAGSNPLLGDTDDDDVNDDKESIWWDGDIKWPNNPEPEYIVVELDELNLDFNKYGDGVAPSSPIQSENSSTQDDWIIQSLSNAGHVLVVEDKRGNAGSNGHLNPTTIPNSVINHVWVPSSQSWVTLKNDEVSSSNQTALGVANAVSKNGKVGGFAWIPLQTTVNGVDVPYDDPGVERIAVLWSALDITTPPALLSQYEEIPYSSFATEHKITEVTPFNIAVNGISDTGEPLYNLANSSGISLLLGATKVANPSSFKELAGYSMTSQGDTFYSDLSSSGLVIKEAGASTTSDVDDGGNRPNSFTVAARATHTQNSTDIIALSPNLWFRDAFSWKKVEKHPLHGFLQGKGISNEGVMLGLDGKSVIANGQILQIKDRVSSTGWSDFKMAKMNDSGMMVGRASKMEDVNGVETGGCQGSCPYLSRFFV